MNITHDLIAAVTGPGWKYGLSRLLINDQDEGVVFIAGSNEPFAFFDAVDVKTSRGRGTSAEGDITWRRRGSSCQYKLAKCKVSTATLEGWWTDALEATPDEPADPPVVDPVAEATAGDDTQEMNAVSLTDEVPSGSASKVMEWVGDDADRARAAMEVESQGQQRKGLTADLERILEAEELL